HDLLNFRSTLAACAQFGIAVIFFCREILGITVTAKYLNPVIGYTHSSFGGVELCHRRFLCYGEPEIFQRCRPEGQQPGRLYSCGHIGQLERDTLKRRDRAVKLVPFLRIFQGRFESACRYTKTECGERDSAAVENL